MNLEELVKKSDLQISPEKILFSEPMKKHTTFKIGGPAECLIKIESLKDLKEILKFVNENKIPLTIIGNGSNLLVSDKGIKGITLKINLQEIKFKEEKDRIEVTVGSGYKIGKLARVLVEKEISGFEELSLIPGTIGGAVRMNAGAHGKEIKDVIQLVKCIDYNGNEKEFTSGEMKFEYRRSMLKDKKYIVTEVKMLLQKGKKEEIKAKIEEYAKYRKERQPLEFPSAGSTFKRGNDFITAKLIEEAGLKGYSIGGAEVSTKHSGFVINKGNATAQDVLQLTKYIEDEIYKKFKKKIELEIEVIGN